MTISVVQTKGAAGAGSPTTLNFTGAAAPGNSIVVWIGEYNTTGTAISSSAPTYNGSSVTGAAKLVEVQQVGTNRMYFAIWLLPNIASSGTSVAVSTTNGRADASSHYYIAEVSGLGANPVIDSASPNPATNSNNGSANPSSGATGNAAASSGIALGGMMQDTNSTSWTVPGAPWTNIANPAVTTSYCGASYSIFTSSGTSYTWNTTIASGQWSAGAVILDAAAGAGTTAPAATVPPPILPHPTFTTQLLEEAYQRADWQAQGVADLNVTFASTSGGIDTYNVISPWNVPSSGPQAQQTRVLKPTAPNTAYPHAFLIMLPVDTNQGTTFGDPLAVAQSLGAHNTYNLTIIEPGYAIHGAVNSSGCWYGDNPLDPGASEEKFTLLILNWMKANLATSGQELTYLIGFSRSGLGAQFLQFRHPYLFSAVASWDSCWMMTDYDGTDPFGFVGGHPENVFGTSVSFQANYELTAAHLAAWQATGQYGINRIWIGQGPDFTAEAPAYHSALNTAGIPHTYGFANTGESHAWHTDWVAAALQAIIPSNEPTTLPQQIPRPTLQYLLNLAELRLDPGTTAAITQGSAAVAAAAGAAPQPTTAVTVNAGVATAAGAALAPSAQHTATSAVATAASVAMAPQAAPAATAGVAAATSQANAPATAITVNAAVATALAIALQPIVNTSGNTNAPAAAATSVAVANAPAVAITATAGVAAAAATAPAPIAAANALAGIAAAMAAALQPSVTTAGGTTATAAVATAAAAAMAPQRITLTINAGVAATMAVGVAPPPLFAVARSSASVTDRRDGTASVTAMATSTATVT